MSGDGYSRAFQAAVFPLLDRLNGTSISDKLRRLLASEHDDPVEIVRRQDEQLGRVVASARERSAFYRDSWSSGRPGPASNHPALDGLPVVTKAQLRAAKGAFPVPDSGKALSFVTSGSTGAPMTFHRSREQESWFWALRFRIWSWAGYGPGDPYLTINLNPRTHWKKRLQDQLFRCSYLTFNADNQDSERVLDTLKAGRIQHLNGFSSSLYVLARYMLERKLENPGVHGITGTGDTLFPTYREAIESAFGTRVLDYYGAGGEGVHIASQCLESGELYHVLPENTVMELLGPDGPVEPGGLGRIVVTQLHNDCMPLIRYDLEDLARPAPIGSSCSCGRSLPLVGGIEGRVPDLIATPDGAFLVPHFFVVLFKTVQGVERYQVVQRESDRLHVRLVGREGANRGEVERAVRREIGAATRGSLETEFEWMSEIPLFGAGKRRLVISEISPRIPVEG